MTLDFNKFSKDTQDWVSLQKISYFPTYAVIARLYEEYGELGREILHKSNIKKKNRNETPSEIGQELADIIFALTCISNPKKIENIQEKFLEQLSNYTTSKNKKKIPSHFYLHHTLGNKINNLSNEIYKEKQNNEELADKIVQVVIITLKIADHYSINIMNEWNKMVQEKLYKKDIDKYAKI